MNYFILINQLWCTTVSPTEVRCLHHESPRLRVMWMHHLGWYSPAGEPGPYGSMGTWGNLNTIPMSHSRRISKSKYFRFWEFWWRSPHQYFPSKADPSQKPNILLKNSFDRNFSTSAMQNTHHSICKNPGLTYKKEEKIPITWYKTA